MAGLWLDELADLYSAMARAGLADPRRVDDLELWECASVLGLDRGKEQEAGAAPGAWTDPTQPKPVAPGERDLIAERLYAYEHGLPPPEAEPHPGPLPVPRTLSVVKDVG